MLLSIPCSYDVRRLHSDRSWETFGIPIIWSKGPSKCMWLLARYLMRTGTISTYSHFKLVKLPFVVILSNNATIQDFTYITGRVRPLIQRNNTGFYSPDRNKESDTHIEAIKALWTSWQIRILFGLQRLWRLAKRGLWSLRHGQLWRSLRWIENSDRR